MQSKKNKGFLSGFYNNNAYSLPQIIEYGPAQERQPEPGSPIFNWSLMCHQGEDAKAPGNNTGRT